MSKEVRAKFVSIEQALDPEENTAPKVGGVLVQFHDEVEIANSDLKLQIKQAELDKQNYKGIFGSLDALEALYPRTKTKESWF